MNISLKFLRVLVLFLGICVIVYGKNKPLDVKNYFTEESELVLKADKLGYSEDNNWALAEGHVVAEYGSLKLTADKVEINQKTLDFKADGKVHLEVEGRGSWDAVAVSGNIVTKAFKFGPYRIDTKVWHFGGESAKGKSDGSQELKDSWISTCECEEPHYCLRARKIVREEDGSFVARHVTLEFGGIPVFYLPIFWGSSDGGNSGWIFKVGYTGKLGFATRIGRVWKHDDEGSNTQVYGDFSTKHGFGLGLGGEYHTSNNGRINMLAYGIHDWDEPGKKGYDRRFKSKSDRYRLNLNVYQPLPLEGATLRLNFDKLSDISMLEDWFKRDYRDYYQPISFMNLEYSNRYFTIAWQVRPRINDFYTVVETLPELSIDVPTIGLGETPFEYKSQSKAGYYQMKWRNHDLSREQCYSDNQLSWLYNLDEDEQVYYTRDPRDYSSFRFDTLHTLSAPVDLLDYLKFTPWASFRATAYSRTSKNKVTQEELADMIDADNPDDKSNMSPVSWYDNNGGSKLRLASEYGAELRSHVYSDWGDFSPASWLQVDGAKHVLEPYVDYVYAPNPSESRDHIYYFDEIDRLEKQNFIRFGLDQYWQTHTEGKERRLVSMEQYFDWHMEKDTATGDQGGNLGNRLTVYPRKDLSMWFTDVFDAGESHNQRAEIGGRYGEIQKLNVRLSYIYRHAHLSRSVYSMGNPLVDFTGENGYLKKNFEATDVANAALHVPLNSITSLECEWEYDFDKSRLSNQTYRLARQLHCWTVEVGVGWDNREFETMVLFRLTAFPSVKIDVGF